MTIEQITAINNGMSMLADLFEAASMMSSIEDYKEYTNQHIKALRDSGVDNNIVEHFESLCHSYLPVVEDAVRRDIKYSLNYEEDEEWEEIKRRENEKISYPSMSKEDYAALQELKAKLEANNSSL